MQLLIGAKELEWKENPARLAVAGLAVRVAYYVVSCLCYDGMTCSIHLVSCT